MSSISVCRITAAIMPAASATECMRQHLAQRPAFGGLRAGDGRHQRIGHMPAQRRALGRRQRGGRGAG